MFGLGFWEIAIIAVAVVIFVQPKDLPGLFFRIGRLYGQLQAFNRSVRSTMRTIEADVERQDRGKRTAERESVVEQKPNEGEKS